MNGDIAILRPLQMVDTNVDLQLRIEQRFPQFPDGTGSVVHRVHGQQADGFRGFVPDRHHLGQIAFVDSVVVGVFRIRG
jgi:hypothetical protein